MLSPSEVMSSLPTRMRATALHHAGLVGQLTTLREVMFSTTVMVLGRSPSGTSRVEVMNELTTKFQELEELCSWINGPGVRICILLLVPLPGHARGADPLEEAAGQLEAAMARRCQANAELEALRASVALVRDSILGNTGRSSSLATSLAEVAGEVENQINKAAANGVWWGTHSSLVAVLSHFPELDPRLELLGPRRDADLSDDRVDNHWPLVSAVLDSLALLVPHHFPAILQTTWSSSGAWPVVLLFCKIWQTRVEEV
jgi:hypothetical protein